jgi:hypothetical protein
MSRAEIVLFTGAGFSLDGKDFDGNQLPSGEGLRRELWDLCFGGLSFDPAASLADLYAAALRLRGADLQRLLQRRLTVDPASLPDYYRLYFGLPWLRCYTLNVDDLERAAENRFRLRRVPQTISATTAVVVGGISGLPPARILEVVHLNGFLSDPPESLTFSEGQYASRLASQEPWYARCVNDIMCRPVVFIGTPLNESLLWQHMELRRRREHRGRDLRPTSILVSPTLSLPRREVLRDSRIEWFEGTAQSFANEVLRSLAVDAARGFTYIDTYSEGRIDETPPLVAELAADRPDATTEYLLGEEPQWSDILSGRSVPRSHDDTLYSVAVDILDGRRPNSVVAVTGTAGTGKSTALMRLALRLSSAGTPVLWFDRYSVVRLARARDRMRGIDGRLALAIDDADLYGWDLIRLLRDLVPRRNEFLVAIATRSAKLDEIASRLAASGDVPLHEHDVPPLTDEDIDALVATLDRHNRLGRLKGESDAGRRKAFREQAGRQMLVAMIQATSGEIFEEKAQDELTQLQGNQRYLYSLACVASSLRSYLTRDELVLACEDPADEALPALEPLTARHLIVAESPVYRYRARHRVIADLVVDKLQELRELKEVLIGLAWALAAKVDPSMDRKSRLRKLLTAVYNHEFLLRLIGVMDARALYSETENVLQWDYHYWLQRGSLEVEAGDVRLAENFLSAAYSMAPEDYRVQTAYGYMLLRKAVESPSEIGAAKRVAKASEMLRDVIANWGAVSAYPFHVLGSQGLAWARHGTGTREEKRTLLRDLLDVVEQGFKLHPTDGDLGRLQTDVRKEYLMTVAVDRPADSPP